MFFKPIYKRIVDDFAFLSDYGFWIDCNIIHYVHPSVLFKSNGGKLQIGYEYDDHRMYLLQYASADSHEAEDLLADIVLIGKSYRDQVEQVKTILMKKLDSA